tara:strand:- start:3221 stop:3439 length:219 start_codon:yes stop_codon:yes gene_type:complete
LQPQVPDIVQEGSDRLSCVSIVPGERGFDFINCFLWGGFLVRYCWHGFSFAPERVPFGRLLVERRRPAAPMF